MGNRVSNNPVSFWSNNNCWGAGDNLRAAEELQTVAENSPLGASVKLFEASNDALAIRRQIAAKYAPAASLQEQRSASDADLRQRTDALAKVFTGGGRRTYEAVAPHLQGLSAADAKQLRALYQQQTGRDLLKDVDNYLFLEDRLRAFQTLAPERIHEQTEPQAMGSAGNGIKMDPPTREVLQGAQIKYQLDLPDEIGGNRRISHLIRSENANVEEAGADFTADYSEEKNYRVTFETRYGDGLPEFYTYRISVKNAETKAANELNNLAGSAPDAELYQKYLDVQIGDVQKTIDDLGIRRDQLKNDIQNGVGNSSDKYDELRAVEKQISSLSGKLSEMTTARAEMTAALADSVGKPVPLKAVLIARENGQTIPLQLYAKNLGGGKWAIVDLTNASKPRTWTGEGALPADALNEAWNKFVSGTNDLPAGQIAAEQPKGLGFQENKTWNSASSGQSTLKQWSNGLGAGSIALAVLGGLAAVGPGTQPATVPLLLGSGVLGGASAGTNLADRVNNNTFQWKSTETALDLLGIAGGIASLGGLGAMTGAGRTILANGAKYTVQNMGAFTRIGQVAANGANAAGGILIANQYVDAIDKVNRSSMSNEQKASATRDILLQAATAGGLMVLGIGISGKLARLSKTAGVVEGDNPRLTKDEQLLKVLNEQRQSANTSGKFGGLNQEPQLATANDAPIEETTSRTPRTSKTPLQTAEDLNFYKMRGENIGGSRAPVEGRGIPNRGKGSPTWNNADTPPATGDGKPTGALKGHAGKHGGDKILPPEAQKYYDQAVKNMNFGAKFEYTHNGQIKTAYVTKVNEEDYLFTGCSRNSKRIFTHYIISKKGLENIGISLKQK